MTFLNLDKNQLVTVTKKNDTKTIVVAGAGSGKTRCLAARALFCRLNSDPNRIILCVTYTTKAANELGTRLKHYMKTPEVQAAIKRVGLEKGKHKGFWTGTLHSLALDMLKDLTLELWDTLPEEESAALNELSPLYKALYKQDPNAYLLSESDSDKIWEECVSELRAASQIPPKQGRLERRGDVIRAIWNARACQIEDGKTLNLPIEDGKAITNLALIQSPNAILQSENRMARRYFLEKRKRKVIDFDDILWLAGCMLRLCPSLKNTWGDHLAHILIDEAQDLSLVDWFFLESLPGFKKKESFPGLGYTLIGDPRQEIFGFRSGSTGDNLFWNLIQNESWADEVTYLSTNYRSGTCIVALGTKIVQNSNLFTSYESKEEAVTKARAGAPRGIVKWHVIGKKASLEDAIVASAREIKQGADPEDTSVIITRTNQQCEQIKELLSKEGLDGFDFSTIHSAKGREWDNVILMGLGPGKFPVSTSPWTTLQMNLRSEARLLYVAVTRAKKILHVFEPESGEFYPSLGLVLDQELGKG